MYAGFDDVIYASLARGFIKGFLKPWSAQELEALILRSDSQSQDFADFISQDLVPPEVADGVNSIVHKFKNRVPQYLNMRRLWQECEQHRPDLLPLISKHQEWFKRWLAAIRSWVEGGFQGNYAPT